MFFPNKPDEDWYWPLQILYTIAFFTLFDQSLQKSFWLWFYERNFQRQFRAGEWQKTAKENAVVKNFDELGRVKGGGTGGGSGAWSISVLRLAHKIEPRSTGVDRIKGKPPSCIQLIWERLSEKVHATTSKGIVGGFSSLFFREIWKNWHERPRKCVCKC